MHTSTKTDGDGSFFWIDIEKLLTYINVHGLLLTITFVICTIMQAIEEAHRAKYLSEHSHELVPNTKKRRFIANGYYKLRKVYLFHGISVEIRLPRVRDMCRKLPNSSIYASKFFNKYERVSQNIANFALAMYLKGISQKNICPLIDSIFRQHVPGFSQSSISYKKIEWMKEYNYLKSQDLSYLYSHIIFVDGTYVRVKGEKNDLCIISIISFNGKEYNIILWELKESESAQEYAEVFGQLLYKQHMGQPIMVVVDGAPGCSVAIKQFFPDALIQRCWVHKTRNILALIHKIFYNNNKLKNEFAIEIIYRLRSIYYASNYEESVKNFNFFKDKYADFPKLVKCIDDDIEELLSFFKISGFNHYQIYTTNVIESLFATVKPKLSRAKNMFSRPTIDFTTYQFVKNVFNRK